MSYASLCEILFIVHFVHCHTLHFINCPPLNHRFHYVYETKEEELDLLNLDKINDVCITMQEN